jgi:hypothetical protein
MKLIVLNKQLCIQNEKIMIVMSWLIFFCVFESTGRTVFSHLMEWCYIRAQRRFLLEKYVGYIPSKNRGEKKNYLRVCVCVCYLFN